MCLLIVKPAGATVPTEYLEEAADANPHGCGIAYATGRRVKVKKGAHWGADDLARHLDRIGADTPALIHFRWKTHGPQDRDNTHPFHLPGRWAAAHNGIITIPTRTDESDTRAFLRLRVHPLLSAGADLSAAPIVQRIGAMVPGNKLAFLHGDGRWGIANEPAGDWEGGVWYSNDSYLPLPQYYRGSSYGRSYDYSSHGGFAAYAQTARPKTAIPYDCTGDEYAGEQYAPRPRPLSEDPMAGDLMAGWTAINPRDAACDYCGLEFWDDEDGLPGPFLAGPGGAILCHGCYRDEVAAESPGRNRAWLNQDEELQSDYPLDALDF